MRDDRSARMRITRFFASLPGMVLAGCVIGIVATLLQKLGNPPNMGICVACFTRDTAGALGLHRAAVVQAIRPEIIGFVLGSMVAALLFREFRPRGGSAPIARFMLGIFAMIGALVFLGCPWRALLRLAGGDGNAIVGLLGLLLGVGLGCICLKRGYTLGRAGRMPGFAGLLMPLFMVLLLVLLLFQVSTGEGGALFSSRKGPGAMLAPLAVSLGAGCLVGILAQRTRFCTMGAVRDALLIRDFHLAAGVGSLLGAAFLMNLALGQFQAGYEAMPISHANALWNFLGMTLSGLAFALAGGCPGRQFFLAGEGDGDSAVFVMGMLTGAGFAHNFHLAGVPDRLVDGAVQVGGPGPSGQVAVVLGLVFCALLGCTARAGRAT